MVIHVDFRRSFGYWAAAAGVREEQLQDRWHLDDAYRQHEIGAIDFPTYTEALSRRLGIELPLGDWERGWNELFVGAYEQVVRRLPELGRKFALFCFTNTNTTHQNLWSVRFQKQLRQFRHIYVSSEIGLRKPDSDAYLHVASDMGFAPGDIVFVDDTRENVDGAIEAGMDARWVRSDDDVVRVLDALLYQSS